MVETIENIFREKIINREYDSYLKSVDSELLLSLSLSLSERCLPRKILFRVTQLGILLSNIFVIRPPEDYQEDH